MKKTKTMKAWAVIKKNKELVYQGGLLDAIAIFPSNKRKHANAFAIACFRAKLNELDKYVVPCTITYQTEDNKK